jgi:predicted transcriptional regulator
LEAFSQAAQQEEKMLKAVADLAKSGEKATARNIGRSVHISTAQAELTLASLRESGIVEKTADGKALIYKLAPSPAAETG